MKLNDKFILKCKSSKCFSSVPFKETEFKKLKYENPLFFFSHFWKKYEKFREKYIKENNKPPTISFLELH